MVADHVSEKTLQAIYMFNKLILYSKLFLNDKWRTVSKFARKRNEKWGTSLKIPQLNKTTDCKILKRDVL